MDEDDVAEGVGEEIARELAYAVRQPATADGRLLLQAIRACKWSRAKAARALGVHYSTVKRILEGDRPLRGSMRRLVRVLISRPDLAGVVDEVAKSPEPGVSLPPATMRQV